MRSIAAALKSTLREELLRECQTDGGPQPTLDGPWAMLASEGAGWHRKTRLSPELCAQMRQHFSDDITREILLAAAGIKVSRTCLSDEKLAVLRAISAQHN